jgi:proline dehydrogenase
MMSVLNKSIAYSLPLVPKFLLWKFSKKYVAGTTIDEAVGVIEALNAKGIMATMDVLGEFSMERKAAEASAEMYFEVLRAIDHRKLNSNISIKLTQLGLKIGTDFCYHNVRQIVQSAGSYGNFVRIDMEDSGCTDDTLDIFFRLKEEFDNVGIVLQSYLRRTMDDAAKLSDLTANVRLCKGIYIEPREIAYKDPELVNHNFLMVLERLLKRRSYVGIATHDEKLVFGAVNLINKLSLRTADYEFQMLLGVDEQLRDMLVSDGHPMRIYVPFGKDWHSYCIRRLKENPKIAGYVLSAMLRGK